MTVRPAVQTPQAVGSPRRRLVARVVTEVFAPAQIVAALLVVMAIHLAPPRDAIRWALISIVFASLVPMAYVVAQVRRRRLTDHHVGVRTQRTIPMLVAITSTIVGLVVLAKLGAPRELIALAAAGVAGLGVTLLITLVWKVSMHSAVLGGAITIVLIVFGFQWVVLLAILASVAWARVELGDHSPAEVIGGAGIGTAVAASVFLLLK